MLCKVIVWQVYARQIVSRVAVGTSILVDIFQVI